MFSASTYPLLVLYYSIADSIVDGIADYIACQVLIAHQGFRPDFAPAHADDPAGSNYDPAGWYWDPAQSARIPDL